VPKTIDSIMKNIIKAGLLLAIFNFSACYYDNLEELNIASAPCTVPDTASYAIHIAPLMSSSCGTATSGCHQNRNNGNGQVGLANYTDVQDAIGKSLMDAINHSGAASPMPKGGGKLSDCSIATLQKWIDQGALNN
jgi:hypothetical protein